jgi:hypothetical protein
VTYREQQEREETAPTTDAEVPRRRRESNVNTRDELTKRFRKATIKSVEGIIDQGTVVIDAKEELPHGEFIEWVEKDLRFGKTGLRKAQMLMAVAQHPIISNANHWYAFPASWRTLYELTAIRPHSKLLELKDSGAINPGMTREEVNKLIPGRQQDRGQIIVSADIKRVLRHTDSMSFADAVRNLSDDPGSITADKIEQAAQWLQGVAEAWRADGVA